MSIKCVLVWLSIEQKSMTNHIIEKKKKKKVILWNSLVERMEAFTSKVYSLFHKYSAKSCSRNCLLRSVLHLSRLKIAKQNVLILLLSYILKDTFKYSDKKGLLLCVKLTKHKIPATWCCLCFPLSLFSVVFLVLRPLLILWKLLMYRSWIS